MNLGILIKYYLAVLLLFPASCLVADAAVEKRDMSGKVVDSRTGEALAGVAVNVVGSGLWAISDAEGRFSFKSISDGTYTLTASCLGYVDRSLQIRLSKDLHNIVLRMDESSLALEEVVVTAQRKKDDMNTTMTFGTAALSHLQMSDIADVGSLLPGGKTVNQDLTVNTPLALRDGGMSYGNSAFGTAVEINGVRIGNNASFGELTSIGTRNIATENIESIEVMTGVPSVEYGDFNSGMIRINTKKGRTPVGVTFSINPRTWQVSASKGIDLGRDRGVLNVSGEWTRATAKLSSPFSSYTRRELSFLYSNTFAKILKFEAGVTGNIGGMNTKDDPDAYTGTYTRVRDNVIRANTSLTLLLNRTWITNLKLDASVNFNDNLSKEHLFSSSASVQPAPHSEKEGYFLADRLPLSYFTDRIVDSKELDYAVSLKYEWFKSFGKVRNNLKAGLQWKASGNTGEGEYYADMSLAEPGYRPRPYSQYPYMHNLAVYLEDNVNIPVGKSTLNVSAGVRMENLFLKGSMYDGRNSFSPRFNMRWKINRNFTVRGGVGISEKLPSFYVLYPEQQYRDIQTFGFSHGESATYVYYTIPYQLKYNAALRWQKSLNSELGVDASFAGFDLSVVGFYNRTSDPYRFSNYYTPFSYKVLQLPEGFMVPSDPEVKVDSDTGIAYIKGGGYPDWVPMDVKLTDRTFFNSRYADNGADIHRAGVELILDFPEIRPIRTTFRIDANYSYSRYADDSQVQHYQDGWSHTSVVGRSYQYVGIYANGGSMNSTANGKVSHTIDANVTAITHIPRARIVITCRVEMSLLNRFRNLSVHDGEEYAYRVTADSNSPVEGSIYDDECYTAVKPVAYMDLDGNVREFTAANARNAEFSNLIVRSGNAYTFMQDGYGPYLSANLSVTKEIGKHVSLSFFANNFTNSRMYVTSRATGVKAIFTPMFYYGLTCRLKL